MKLKLITCSGVNEHTNIEELLNSFGNIPYIELGIQVSKNKASFTTPRFQWLMDLYLASLKQQKNLNVALHINPSWVEDFCEGNICPEVQALLDLQGNDHTPFIKRVQLNFKIGRDKTPDLFKLLKVIKDFDRKIILSFNEANATFINELHRRGASFDCLYDSSFGEGKTATSYNAPAFDDVFQGYAGGLSPENISQELKKISLVAKEREIFIDAEGKLKEKEGHVTIERCKTFIKNALSTKNLH